MKRLIKKAALTAEDYIENYPNGYEHVSKGIMTINVDDIIGTSSERRDEYNNDFQPIGEPDARWKRLHERAQVDGNLDFAGPVKLVQVPNEDKYFVYDDGNHRVSVAKNLGIQTINAEVINLVSKDQEGYAYFEQQMDKLYAEIKEKEEVLRDYNLQQQKLYDTKGITMGEIDAKYDEIEALKQPLYTEVDNLYAEIENLKQQL